MREEIKELLEQSALLDDLRDDLCYMDGDLEERIEYLKDLKECIDVLIKEEYENFKEPE